jgi:hypothetical protein
VLDDVLLRFFEEFRRSCGSVKIGAETAIEVPYRREAALTIIGKSG